MTAPELMAETGLGRGVAGKALQLAWQWGFTAGSRPAIEAYTGVVFAALGAGSLPPEKRMRLGRSVRLISSLYGWLRPDDPISPYRLEYGARLAPDGRTLSAWWSGKLAATLTEYLGSTATRQVLNLLPADAARCIDWKKVAAAGSQAEVWRVEFVGRAADGSWRTVPSTRLKQLRGRLTREIIRRDILTAEEIAGMTVEGGDGREYVCSAPAERTLCFAESV